VNAGDTTPACDWNEIVERARNGDEEAAAWLVGALHGQVLRIVRGHLPHAADEQDLVQEVFMKAFGAIDGFLGLQPFPNWVARIALNTCYDHLRRQKARPEVRFADLSAEDVEFVESIMERDTAHDGRSREADGLGLVEKLLATLKPRERMVLQLLDLERKSLKEVCALTGWGLSKVKVTAMRGRRKLNEALNRLEGGRG
jgi:RNA polymerase sigma-70 factor (ECF subfamily)